MRFFELSVAGALIRYRILAFIVGVGLSLLVFVGVPIQIFAHNKDLVAVVGPIHGIFYILYLISALDLVVRCRWNVIQLLPPVLAGLVPGAAFVIEHYTTKKVKNEFPEIAQHNTPANPNTPAKD